MTIRESKRAVILLGYPRGFGERKNFERKVAKILSSIDDFEIVAIDDDRHFIRDSYPTKVREVVNTEIILDRQIRTLVERATHVLLFWDGLTLSEFVYYTMLLRKTSRVIPVEVTRVCNKDRHEEFEVYIGRGSIWGNPYRIGPGVGDRRAAIEMYRKHFYEIILNDPAKRRAVLALKGKRLGCHCKPDPCHGDVIAEFLNTFEGDSLDDVSFTASFHGPPNGSYA